jgi:hypothetical protein
MGIDVALESRDNAAPPALGFADALTGTIERTEGEL